jgi:rhodanese-related sulfurtransferase
VWLDNGEIIETIDRITVDELLSLDLPASTIVDVRKPGEYEASHINNALLLPLDFIQENLSDYPKQPFILHCAGGYRSMIAASILKKNGIHDLKDIIGGFNAIPDDSGLTTTSICQSGN